MKTTMKMMKETLAKGGIVVLLALGVADLPAINYPVGTFLISGVVKNEKNLVIGTEGDDATLRLQAVATNRTILAECAFYRPTSTTSPENFLLEVPLSLAATSRSASVGDTVRLCLAREGEAQAVSSEPICLYAADGTTNLVLQLYETVSYTNKDGYVATLPVDYVKSLAIRYPEQDPLTAYKPFEDDDGDGVSNYMEYRAGTDPFEKKDRLSIRAFERTGDRVALTFEYVNGVLYGVDASPELGAKASWTSEKLATGPGKTPDVTSILPGTGADEAGSTTIYLLPVEKAEKMFYKLEVK